MNDYLFDVTQLVTVRVKADSQEEAEALIRNDDIRAEWGGAEVEAIDLVEVNGEEEW